MVAAVTITPMAGSCDLAAPVGKFDRQSYPYSTAPDTPLLSRSLWGCGQTT
jgi:hypothetical protein